jgi:ABC-2 type transport system ATP-binding protein
MTDTRVILSQPASPATDGVAVQVRGLRMSYGSTEVLRGVDFDVRYGEVFCLLGPNGAGKTTTLEILEGFRPAARPASSVSTPSPRRPGSASGPAWSCRSAASPGRPGWPS